MSKRGFGLNHLTKVGVSDLRRANHGIGPDNNMFFADYSCKLRKNVQNVGALTEMAQVGFEKMTIPQKLQSRYGIIQVLLAASALAFPCVSAVAELGFLRD